VKKIIAVAGLAGALMPAAAQAQDDTTTLIGDHAPIAAGPQAPAPPDAQLGPTTRHPCSPGPLAGSDASRSIG